MGKAILEILGKVGDPGVAGLVVLAGLGAFICFLGYRYFRISAGVAGFAIGLELAGRLSMHQGWSSLTTTILGVLGGAALCALFVILSYLAIFGFGAMLAATLVSLAARAAHAPMQPLMLVLAALIGGFGGLLLRQFAVVVATSLYGGLMAIAALFALLRGQGTEAALQGMMSLEHTGDVVLLLLCMAVLVTGGTVVQFRYGKNPRVDGGK